MKKKAEPATVIIFAVLLAVGLAGGYFLYQKYVPSRKHADLNLVYGLSGQETALVINGKLSESRGILADDTVYLELDTAKQLFNRGFYWEKETSQLLYTNALYTYSSVIGSDSYSNPELGEETSFPEKISYEEEGILYIAASYIAQFTDMEYTWYDNPSRLVIHLGREEETKAILNKAGSIRRLCSIKSDIVYNAPEGTEVTVLYEMEDWSEVCTPEGYMGYIQNKILDNYRQDVRQSSFSEPEYTNISLEGKICVAWHQVKEQQQNENLSSLLENTDGITVISPTWLSLNDNEGNFDSLSDQAYVEQAHGLGLDIWVLVDDFNENMSISQVLGKKSSRDRLRNGLIAEVQSLGADGINIDFEYISQASGDDFIQFLRELSVDCRRLSLVLSVDNYMPTGGKDYYDLETQGKVVDYVILMGYDEHWNGSEAGPNASIPYVDGGISAALQMVPAERLINAIPFYTRVWTETPEASAEPGAEIREDGKSVYDRYALSSEACDMERAMQLLSEHNVQPEWDMELGLYYGEYDTSQGKVRIWLEDAASIEEKMKLIAYYGLAGVACWKLGLETADVWPVIGQYLPE